MTIFNGLLIATFLILLASSVAVVGSMIVLGLFDLAFGKRRKVPIAVEASEQGNDMVERVELNETASLKTEIGELDNNVVPFKRTA